MIRRRNRSRRHRHATGRRLAWAGAGAALIAAAAIAAGTATSGLPVINFYTVYAQFHDAANLDPYSDVRIAGKRVGQVLSVSFDHGIATAALQLSPSVGPLPADTTARIGYKSLIGDKLVELDPGHDRATLPDGGTIPLAHTATAVELSSITAIFDARRRLDLQETVRALGEGLLDRGVDINTAIAAATPLSEQAGALAEAINDRTGAASRLAPALDLFTSALAPISAELADTFRPSADAFGAIAAQRSALEATLEQAPSTLSELQSNLVAANPLLRETIVLSRQISRAARYAPGALSATASLLRAAPRPLAQARPFLAQLTTAIPPTEEFLARLDPLIGPTGRAFSSLLPILDELGSRSCDVNGLAANLYGITKFGTNDPGDPEPEALVRGELGGDAGSVADLPALPSSAVGHDPYPKPCTAINDTTLALP